MRCKFCKYWGVVESGVCDLVNMEDDVNNMLAHKASIVAYAHDDQGLTASLKTGPEFGCRLFKWHPDVGTISNSKNIDEE